MNSPHWMRHFCNWSSLVAFVFPRCVTGCALIRKSSKTDLFPGCILSFTLLDTKQRFSVSLSHSRFFKICQRLCFFISFQIKAVDATTLHLQKKGGRVGGVLKRTTPQLNFPPSPVWHVPCPSALSTSCRPLRTLLRRYVAAFAVTGQSLYPTVTLSSRSTTLARRKSSLWIESRPRTLLATC